MRLAFFIKIFNQQKNIIMGRGDIKTKRGKIFAGSFGKSRPTTANKAAKAVSVEKKDTEKKAAPKKVEAKKEK